MLEKYEVCCGIFHGFDWSPWTTGTPPERLGLLPPAQEHILAQEDGKDRLRAGRARAVAGVRAGRAARRGAARSATTWPSSRRCGRRWPSARRATAQTRRGPRPRPSGRSSRGPWRPDEVIDIFAAAGLEEAGHLDPLRRVPGRGARHAAAEPGGRAAAEAAERRDQARAGARTSCRRARSPRCWSRRSARYQNRAIETAQVIEELIALAKEMREADAARRGAGADRRRGGLLRRPGDQRQRREGAGRRDAAGHRPGAGRDGAQQRHDRLDGARERPRADCA